MPWSRWITDDPIAAGAGHNYYVAAPGTAGDLAQSQLFKATPRFVDLTGFPPTTDLTQALVDVQTFVRGLTSNTIDPDALGPLVNIQAHSGHDFGFPYNPPFAYTPATGLSLVTERANLGDPLGDYHTWATGEVSNSSLGFRADLAAVLPWAPDYLYQLGDYGRDWGVDPTSGRPVQWESDSATFLGWEDATVHGGSIGTIMDRVMTYDIPYPFTNLMSVPPHPGLQIRYQSPAPVGPLPDIISPGTGTLLQHYSIDPAAHGWDGDAGIWDWEATEDSFTLLVSAIPDPSFVLHFHSDYYCGDALPLFYEYAVPAHSADHHEQLFSFIIYFGSSRGAVGINPPSFQYRLPRFRYWMLREPNLRLSQRNDGAGIAKNPRLSAAGGAATSVQARTAPRVGGGNTYR